MIEDTLAMLSESGITVVEAEEGEDGDSPKPATAKSEDGEDKEEEESGGNVDEDTIGRTDDPVRMYLREMGSVELLSREGEIAIAKRIEAGRDMMIMGLCESPITFHAIIQWSEALNSGDMQLREILDLDAMLSKEPPADKMAEGAEDEDDDGEISEATAGPTIPARSRHRRAAVLPAV
jgi:RNA polymerase primary sigma factor